jgi:hypothetical protein
LPFKIKVKEDTAAAIFDAMARVLIFTASGGYHNEDHDPLLKTDRIWATERKFSVHRRRVLREAVGDAMMMANPILGAAKGKYPTDR